MVSCRKLSNSGESSLKARIAPLGSVIATTLSSVEPIALASMSTVEQLSRGQPGDRVEVEVACPVASRAVWAVADPGADLDCARRHRRCRGEQDAAVVL